MKTKNKKCITKKCEDCQFYQSWDVTNDQGVRKQVQKCGIQVLFEEIPRIRGAIDGIQAAANEARNRAMEAKELVNIFGNRAVQTISQLTTLTKEYKTDDSERLPAIEIEKRRQHIG